MTRWRPASASLQALTWAWQIYPTLKEHRTSSSVWDLSDVTSSGTSGISATQLSKACAGNAHSESLLHLGRRVSVAKVLIPPRITVGSTRQLPGKACAAIWRNARSKFSGRGHQLGEPELCGTQQNDSYIRHTLNRTNLGTNFKKCCSGPNVHLSCSEKKVSSATLQFSVQHWNRESIVRSGQLLCNSLPALMLGSGKEGNFIPVSQPLLYLEAFLPALEYTITHKS